MRTHELSKHNKKEVVGVVLHHLLLTPSKFIFGVENKKTRVKHPNSFSEQKNKTKKQNFCPFKILSFAKRDDKEFFELVTNFSLNKIIYQ